MCRAHNRKFERVLCLIFSSQIPILNYCRERIAKQSNNMRISPFKTVSILWIFTLILGSQICLIDYPLNFVTGLTHNRHESKTHEHEKHNGTNHHSDEQNTASLCCKDFLYLYLINSGLDNFKLAQQFLSEDSLPFELLTSGSFQSYFYFSTPTKTISPRLRDKYALSCLLHAPPRV